VNETVSHLVTLLVGAVIGGLAKFVQDAYTRRKETRAIAAALEAEISVSLEGIRGGDYIGMCDRVIAYLSVPGHTVAADDYFDIAVPETPCPLFNAQLPQVGLLAEATGPVVKTCQLYEGVCLELRYLRERHLRLPLKAKQLVEQHKAVKARFQEILQVGELAISELQRQKLWWWRRRGTRLVAKDNASPYRGGRTFSWLKVRQRDYRVEERGWDSRNKS
jgi:hypothetical protein